MTCSTRVLSKDCIAPAAAVPVTATCAPFTLRVGNKQLAFDGQCLTVGKAAPQAPDGTYTRVTLRDGQIIAADQAPVGGYTPNECCGSAGSTSGGGASTVTVAPQPNWLQNDPDGLRVNPTIQWNGATATGSGTASDPMIVTVTGGGTTSSTAVTYNTQTLDIAGTGAIDSPLIMNLKPVTETVAGTYFGLKFDKYGRLVSVPGGRGVVKALLETSPAQVTATETATGSGVYTIGLPDTGVAANTYSGEDHTFTLDAKGRVTASAALPQRIAAGQFTFIDSANNPHTVSFDNRGHITSVT